MKVKIDQILVIDIEATCWRDGPPPGQENEIIEIGVVPLDVQSGERLARESLLVRPQKSEVSPFCTSLTTLTQEDVDGGMAFDEACKILQEKFGSALRPWASWGNYDRTMFESQCQSLKIPYPFSQDHINIKTLFALMYRLHRPVGTSRALEMAGIEFEGTRHRGVDDAWNTAQMLSLLLFCEKRE